MPKTIKYIGTRDRWPELAITGKQSLWQPGQQEERSDAEAALLFATGFFAGVPVQVEVSLIPEAAIATSVGAIGALYELADGPNAGAKLTWAIPAGESTPTWCWWLWPQSAYTA